MSDAASQCRAANRAFRRENPHLERQHLLTRGAMCDLTPPCVTDMLFQHEFYWGRHASMAGPPSPPGTLTPRADWRSRCRTWTRDEDWPTVEPHLSRKGASARRRLRDSMPEWAPANGADLERAGPSAMPGHPRANGCPPHWLLYLFVWEGGTAPSTLIFDL